MVQLGVERVIGAWHLDDRDLNVIPDSMMSSHLVHIHSLYCFLLERKLS